MASARLCGHMILEQNQDHMTGVSPGISAGGCAGPGPKNLSRQQQQSMLETKVFTPTSWREDTSCFTSLGDYCKLNFQIASEILCCNSLLWFNLWQHNHKISEQNLHS